MVQRLLCIYNDYSFVVVATHGSGAGLVNMAAMVTNLELITGRGEILTLSTQEHKDIFKAAQVSLCLFEKMYM